MLTGLKRQTERKVATCCTAALEAECRVDRAQRETERGRVRDVEPDAHAGAARRIAQRWRNQPDLRGLVLSLREARRLNDLRERTQCCAAAGQERQTETDESP